MHALDAFGCFFVTDIVIKETKRNFVQKFMLNKKSPDLFDQFVSMAERKIDVI